MESLTGKIAAAALALLAMGGLGTLVYEAAQSSTAATTLAATATQNTAQAATPPAPKGATK
jgi:hypothetical protein